MILSKTRYIPKPTVPQPLASTAAESEAEGNEENQAENDEVDETERPSAESDPNEEDEKMAEEMAKLEEANKTTQETIGEMEQEGEMAVEENDAAAASAVVATTRVDELDELDRLMNTRDEPSENANPDVVSYLFEISDIILNIGPCSKIYVFSPNRLLFLKLIDDLTEIYQFTCHF